jgi:hypothetical protein
VPLQPETVQLFDGALRFCKFGDIGSPSPSSRIPLLAREQRHRSRRQSGASLANSRHERNVNSTGFAADQAAGYSNLFFG